MPRQKRGPPQHHAVQPSKRKRTPSRKAAPMETALMPAVPNSPQSLQVDYEKLAAEIIKQQNSTPVQSTSVPSIQVPSASVPSTSGSAPSIAVPSLSAPSSTTQAADLLSLIDNVFSHNTGGRQHCSKSVSSTNIHSISLTTDLSAASKHLLQAALSTSSRCAYHRSWHLFLEEWKPSYTSLPVSKGGFVQFHWLLILGELCPILSLIACIGNRLPTQAL
ncbi:uncharacterized protein LOC144618470 [Crassostrea virginica]